MTYENLYMYAVILWAVIVFAAVFHFVNIAFTEIDKNVK